MAGEFVGIIGGTGLGQELSRFLEDIDLRSVETPFGLPSGEIMVGRVADRRVAFLNRHGDGHRFAPGVIPYAANVFALKMLGVHVLLGTGAVGSLNESVGPGELVVVDQFVDKTYMRENSFFNGYGAVHCEMAEPVCGRLACRIVEAAERAKVKTHNGGCYVCMQGPQFSTRAESLMHRQWGGDLIGMTAMPEAKLAREAQMCYGLIAMVSDFDCWREQENEKDKQTLLEEITGNIKTAADNCLQLVEQILRTKEPLVDEKCGCRRSLEMAVWTDKEQIEDSEQEKMQILFE